MKEENRLKTLELATMVHLSKDRTEESLVDTVRIIEEISNELLNYIKTGEVKK